jgi:amino acid adenylation domain-containing protein
MIERIIASFSTHAQRDAFCIQGRFFSYDQVAAKVSDIRRSFMQRVQSLNPRHIGVMIHDDFESYCSCIAVLLSGCGYVPLNPLVPASRILEIIGQARVTIILSSDRGDAERLPPGHGRELIFTSELPSCRERLDFPAGHNDDPAYVIFTSGSTGKPKGTPISRGNLNAFLDSVYDLGWDIGPEDRFLQMSSMTFDMSIITFIVPLCVGACIWTVPEDEIKYLSAYRLLDEAAITFAAVVPSTLAYLRPYFRDIHLPALSYCLVCGEAFPIELATSWSACAPNARIVNIYGPTEATVFTHTYHYRLGEAEKAHNDIMAIGGIVKNMESLVLGEDGTPVASGLKGELCLAGKQLTKGYLDDAPRNRASFFLREAANGETKRYYRTGDIVFQDEDGTYLYVGRGDNQVKIQGFRVELGDIEKHARDFIGSGQAVALAQKNRFGNQQIHLVVEKSPRQKGEIIAYLGSKLPFFMIPANISEVAHMPLNANGKIDRRALAAIIPPPDAPGPGHFGD